MIIVIDFVHHQHHLRFRLAEFLAERGIDGGDAIVGIDDKQNDIRRGNGDIDLKRDLFGEAIIERGADAAGIDNFAGKFRDLRWRGEAVTSDARLVVDNGDFPSDKTIEQSRFPHIRATNDSNSRHGGEYA